MRKLRPDMLKKRLETLEKVRERRDIDRAGLDDIKNVVRNVLTEQGLMEEGAQTVIHDKVAFGEANNLTDKREFTDMKLIKS